MTLHHLAAEFVPHFVDLLRCTVPKIDDIIHVMPLVNECISNFKLHATVRFDPVSATRLLLAEHVMSTCELPPSP